MPILMDDIFKLGMQILRKTKSNCNVRQNCYHKHVTMLDSFLTVPIQCTDSEKTFKVSILGQGATHFLPK